MENSITVVGAFDDLRSKDVRLLEEASKLGPVSVLLLTDEAAQAVLQTQLKFPWAERLYLVQALRFVNEVLPLSAGNSQEILSAVANLSPRIWLDSEGADNEARRNFSVDKGLNYLVISREQLAVGREVPIAPSLSGASAAFSEAPGPVVPSGRKKVIVTGCYDWLHSGHVRFFEEVSTYGDLYVIVGHDANIRLLKGVGHPLLPQEERRYMAGAIRYVTQALVSSGNGWLDAEPEIQRIKPDIYAVNEDGDRGGKREYCARVGLEYLVLKRLPAAGLPPRTSTTLRGF
jgi:cytidyltransferase-like protein